MKQKQLTDIMSSTHPQPLTHKNILKGLPFQGLQLARTFGFPTINVWYECEETYEVIPGVYAGLFRINSFTTYAACIYIHPNDPVDATKHKVECHALDITELPIQLTDDIEVMVHKFIRKPISFKDMCYDEIKLQLQRDIDLSKDFFYD